MGFEDNILNNIDRTRSKKEALSPAIEEAHKKARTMFEDRAYAIQATEFIDLYGKDNVIQDMQKVKELRTKFGSEETEHSKNAKKMAEAFEGIVLLNSELSNWLGDATTFKTSLYDDFINHADMIAEWQREEREPHVLALSVDVTFGTTAIRKKLERIHSKADRDLTGSIKYFKTADGSFRGERRNVPQVVMGVSKETVEELAQLSLNNDKKALGEHPVQRILIEQIYHQLQLISTYAKQNGKQHVAETYASSLRIIEQIRKEKEYIPLGHLADDRVHQEIMREAGQRFA